jgi:hypothetical protein
MRSDNFSLEFLRRISRRRLSAQHGVESISEYIEWRAAQLTPEHLAGLRTDLPLLKIRFTAIVVPEFPYLGQQLKLLCDFFEDTADGVFPAGPDASRKETAFALRYAAQEIDIIPDFARWEPGHRLEAYATLACRRGCRWSADSRQVLLRHRFLHSGKLM